MTPDQFLERATTAIANAALTYCQPSIPSQTLQAALIVQVYDARHASIFLTYYWSLYVHDGRGPFVKPTIMCWFKDPKQDPRLNAGVTPARLADVRHLTADEFYFWLRENHRAERAVYGRLRRVGEPQVGPMIITKEIRRGTSGAFFFENDAGMRGFGATVGSIVGPMFSDWVMNDQLKGVSRLRIPLDVQIVT